MVIEFKRKDEIGVSGAALPKGKKSGLVKFMASAEVLGPPDLVDSYKRGIDDIVKKHEERLAYNAEYQRDLRKIKKLGLNCTVSEYREQKASQK